MKLGTGAFRYILHLLLGSVQYPLELSFQTNGFIQHPLKSSKRKYSPRGLKVTIGPNRSWVRLYRGVYTCKQLQLSSLQGYGWRPLFLCCKDASKILLFRQRWLQSTFWIFVEWLHFARTKRGTSWFYIELITSPYWKRPQRLIADKLCCLKLK